VIDPAVAARLAPVLQAGMDKLRRDGLGHVARAAAADVEAVLEVAQVSRSRRIVDSVPADHAPSRVLELAPSSAGDDFLSASEAADLLGLGGRRVQQLAADGVIRGRMLAGRWLFTRDVIEGYRRDRGREGKAVGGDRPGAGRPAGRVLHAQ
jgi:excisionase family DNA binding protein